MSVRVLLNGIPLRAPSTGVGRCLRSLVEAIRAHRHDVSVGLFDGWNVSRSRLPADLTGQERGNAALQRLLHRRDVARFYLPFQDRLFAAQHPESRYDLYHETNFLLPPFRGPTIATVWDLSLRFHPESHPAGRVRLFETAFASRFSSVERFVVLSRAIRDELCAELGVSAERVAVIPPGVDTNLFHLPSRSSLPGQSAPGPGIGIPPCFVLYVGAIEPRKGLHHLLTAYLRLPAAIRRDTALILAGPLGWGYGSLLRRIRQAAREARVIRLGYVGETVLGALYRRAAAFVYPSSYEGFGLPVLEAMASGAPVVCSDIPALAELTADAALRVSPHDPDALGEALRRVLEDSDLRAQLTARGAERALGYSWRRHADSTADLYREVVER